MVVGMNRKQNVLSFYTCLSFLKKIGKTIDYCAFKTKVVTQRKLLKETKFSLSEFFMFGEIPKEISTNLA
jgi:hypothetical protein